MEDKPDYEKDLTAIRNMMERSAKFISLSGLAGVMAGLYALLASAYAYSLLYSGRGFNDGLYIESHSSIIFNLFVVAVSTLLASLATGWFLSYRKAKRVGASIWNATGKRMLINLMVPLVAGGAFALASLWHGQVGMIAPICLLFYGLALVNASQNLFEEIRFLGYCEIMLGIIAAVYIGYGLLFWAIGFGVLHIVYGAIMYRKYDVKGSA